MNQNFNKKRQKSMSESVSLFKGTYVFTLRQQVMTMFLNHKARLIG